MFYFCERAPISILSFYFLSFKKWSKKTQKRTKGKKSLILNFIKRLEIQDPRGIKNTAKKMKIMDKKLQDKNQENRQFFPEKVYDIK